MSLRFSKHCWFFTMYQHYSSILAIKTVWTTVELRKPLVEHQWTIIQQSISHQFSHHLATINHEFINFEHSINHQFLLLPSPWAFTLCPGWWHIWSTRKTRIFSWSWVTSTSQGCEAGDRTAPCLRGKLCPGEVPKRRETLGPTVVGTAPWSHGGSGAPHHQATHANHKPICSSKILSRHLCVHSIRRTCF